MGGLCASSCNLVCSIYSMGNGTKNGMDLHSLLPMNLNSPQRLFEAYAFFSDQDSLSPHICFSMLVSKNLCAE